MIQSLSNEIFVARAVCYIKFFFVHLAVVVKFGISFRANGTIDFFDLDSENFHAKKMIYTLKIKMKKINLRKPHKNYVVHQQNKEQLHTLFILNFTYITQNSIPQNVKQNICPFELS